MDLGETQAFVLLGRLDTSTFKLDRGLLLCRDVCWVLGCVCQSGIARVFVLFSVFLEMVSFFPSLIFSDHRWNIEALLIFVNVS